MDGSVPADQKGKGSLVTRESMYAKDLPMMRSVDQVRDGIRNFDGDLDHLLDDDAWETQTQVSMAQKSVTMMSMSVEIQSMMSVVSKSQTQMSETETVEAKSVMPESMMSDVLVDVDGRQEECVGDDEHGRESDENCSQATHLSSGLVVRSLNVGV